MNRDQVKGGAPRASDQDGRADPADETVINGAPYDPGKAMGDAAVAGRAAYREEYLRDHGPDLDEWLDGTESGQEI
jgi:hypothetical protein